VTVPHARITLTLRALLDARALAVHIEGAAKRAVVEKVARLDAAQFAMAAVLRQNAVPVHVFYNP
jgi:6-phosphogluconolactonase